MPATEDFDLSSSLSLAPGWRVGRRCPRFASIKDLGYPTVLFGAAGHFEKESVSRNRLGRSDRGDVLRFQPNQNPN